MMDVNQIPYLLQLLDDESAEVRRDVIQLLSSFGPNLKPEVKRLKLDLNSDQKLGLELIYSAQHDLWLKKAWPSWYHLSDDHQKLEKALAILSHYLSGWDNRIRLGRLLDDLAAGFRMKHRSRGPRLLAQYLFQEFGLEGNENDYYDPQNCNLISVITQKKGIPISLSAIYILVGRRLGIDVQGCHFPGHFLAKIHYRGRKVFIDCFNAGQLIEEDEILKIKEETAESMEDVLRENASAESMIKRFLANLIRSFQLEDEEEDDAASEIFVDLFKDLESNLNRKAKQLMTVNELIRAGEQTFHVGQLVKHVRYGYCGIIVDVDETCMATDAWYYGNQSQPRKEQPWYHVLVDGSDQVTYVAQSNLSFHDSGDKKIQHPLLDYFFKQSDDGGYLRNDNPWPNTDF